MHELIVTLNYDSDESQKYERNKQNVLILRVNCGYIYNFSENKIHTIHTNIINAKSVCLLLRHAVTVTFWNDDGF